MWKRFREHFGNKVALLGWLGLTFHLAMIKVYGIVQIYEPREWVLYIEYVLCAFIIYIFIHNSIDDLRFKVKK